MRFTTKLLESDSEIASLILKSILGDAKNYFRKLGPKLQPEIQRIVKTAITNSLEYQSIVSGKLRQHFGLPDGSSRLSQIMALWERIQVETKSPKIKGSQIGASIEIVMIKADYSDVLNLPASVLVTEKGEQLEWLNWLLLAGDKTIIRDYEIVIGPSKYSRTGDAIMKKKVSGKWKVPSEFSGTSRSNWITRVLDSVSSEIDNAIEKAVKL